MSLKERHMIMDGKLPGQKPEKNMLMLQKTF